MRHALVIGASAGLGLALVDELTARGYRVSSAGRSAPARSAVVHRDIEVRHADFEAVLAGVAQAAPLSAVVFVAGDGVFGPAAATSVERAEDMFALNFWAVARCAMSAGAYFRDARVAGAFVPVLSIAARRAVPGEAYYGASKAAAARFVEALAFEYPETRFVPVYPGLMKTGFRGKVTFVGEAPSHLDAGTDPAVVARATADLVEGRRTPRVVGWRERGIDLLERIDPRIYDAVLRRRRPRGEP